MNDAERDAWLREALRHAPDSDALPPSGVSEAILLKARAAAQRGGSRDAHANPLTALWDWLARPPVAAGFASVMAATLVGLMWWDRPMDDAMPRPPALASDRAPAAPSPASTSLATAETRSLGSTSPAPPAAPPAMVTDATKSTPDPRPMNEAANNAVADDGAARRRQRSAPEQAGAADVKRAEPDTATAQRSVDLLAKERALPSEKKNEAPAPFPSTEMQRETPSPRKSLDAAAPNDASKKDVEASRSRAADEVERAAVPPPARPVAPPPAVRPPPVGAAEPAAETPLASGRLAAEERRPAAPAERSVAPKAKGAAATPPLSAAPAAAAPPAATAPATPTAPPPVALAPASAAVATAPARDRADAPQFQQRQSAFGGVREKDAADLGSSAPFRVESERARPEALLRADASARAVAPARVLAAIAAEPERWLRQTAGGDTVALDAGWRAWLAELDAAAAGRWQLLGAAAPSTDGAAARDSSTTLRLVNAGRVAAIVRLDGTRVQVDAAPGTGADRWQATLLAAGAEQLRSTARRLSP